MMRAPISKEKPTKTTITPKQVRQSLHNSKSPRLDSVNSLLAEINLPASRFDNTLEALRPLTIRGSNNNDPLNNPCNLVSPTEKKTTILPTSLLQLELIHSKQGSLPLPTLPILPVTSNSRPYPTKEFASTKQQYMLSPQ